MINKNFSSSITCSCLYVSVFCKCNIALLAGDRNWLEGSGEGMRELQLLLQLNISVAKWNQPKLAHLLSLHNARTIGVNQD